EISVTYGVEVSGRIIVENVDAPPPALPARPALITVEATASGTRIQSAQAVVPVGSTFKFPLLAGAYQWTVRNVPEGYKVRAVTAGSTDLLATPYTIVPGEAPRTIVVTLVPSGLHNG